jgi:molybdopterin-synthase adenylyltransferase
MCPFLRFFIQYRWNVFVECPERNEMPLCESQSLESLLYWERFGLLRRFRSGECTVFRHVLVAGIGALGSELVKNLALLGCERVFMADADVLEEKNMARSLLMRNGIAGESKVSHAITHLTERFPRTKWCGSTVEIADVPPEEFERADILFGCVDTDLARMEMAALTTRYQLDMCDAGLGGTSLRVGRTTWFPATIPGHQAAACFGCLLSGQRRAEILSTWESEVHACWAGPEIGKNQHAWASTPTMASIVAALQLEIALASACKENNAFTLHIDLDGSPMMQRIEHKRSPECPLHEAADDDVFPVCTHAECSVCGAELAPMRRVAWVRRYGMCSQCGNGALIIRKSVREAPAGSVAQ